MYVPSTLSVQARDHRTHRLKQIVPFSESDRESRIAVDPTEITNRSNSYPKPYARSGQGEAYLRIIGVSLSATDNAVCRGRRCTRLISSNISYPNRACAVSSFKRFLICQHEPVKHPVGMRTLQFFSFFSLLIIKYKAFQMLLLHFILHLGRASVNGQGRRRRNSKLSSLKKEI